MLNATVDATFKIHKYKVQSFIGLKITWNGSGVSKPNKYIKIKVGNKTHHLGYKIQIWLEDLSNFPKY